MFDIHDLESHYGATFRINGMEFMLVSRKFNYGT